MNQRWLLDNFEVELAKTDEGLLIQAEDQIRGNIFSKLLNNESVKSISADQFFDMDTLHQLLKDYFEKKPENTSLSISKNGNLRYSSQFLFVTIIKKFEFELQLEKQELDAMTKLGNQVSKLSARILKLENDKDTAVVCALQNFEKVVSERFEKLEKILAKAEERIALLEEAGEVKLLKCEFNLTPEIQTIFQVTNNSKTASSLTSTLHSILAKQSLPKLKKSKFSFQIGKNSWIMVGITTEKQLNKNDAYNDPAAFAYAHDGKFYVNRSPQGNYSKYNEGDEVSFTCDMKTGLIEVTLNKNFVGNHTILKNHLDSETFYPFLYTNCNAGVGATFI